MATLPVGRGRGCQVRAIVLSILKQDAEGTAQIWMQSRPHRKAFPHNFEEDILAVFVQSFRACDMRECGGDREAEKKRQCTTYHAAASRRTILHSRVRSQIIQEAAAAAAVVRERVSRLLAPLQMSRMVSSLNDNGFIKVVSLASTAQLFSNHCRLRDFRSNLEMRTYILVHSVRFFQGQRIERAGANVHAKIGHPTHDMQRRALACEPVCLSLFVVCLICEKDAWGSAPKLWAFCSSVPTN